jgi:hypothetical protein
MASRQTALNRGRSGRTLPGVEPLEDRTCLSTLSFSGHILTLTGDNANDTITIRDDGHGDVTASIKSGSATKSISEKGVQGVVVHTGNGNDTVTYALTGKMTTSRSLEIDLGKGDDQVAMNFSKGVSAPGLNVKVNDGAGYDRVAAAFGSITNTTVNLNVNQGARIDSFFASFNGTIGGKAKVNVNSRSGSGYNGTDINMTSNIGSAAAVTVNTVGGINSGTAHVNYAGQLDGKLTIKEQAGAGGDFLEADVTLRAGSNGTLSDTLLGGPGDDLLVSQLKNYSTKMKSVHAAIDGGSGTDIALVSGKVSVSHAEVL